MGEDDDMTLATRLAQRYGGGHVTARDRHVNVSFDGAHFRVHPVDGGVLLTLYPADNHRRRTFPKVFGLDRAIAEAEGWVRRDLERQKRDAESGLQFLDEVQGDDDSDASSDEERG